MRTVPPSHSPPAFEAKTLGQLIFAPRDLMGHALGATEPQPAGVRGVVAAANASNHCAVCVCFITRQGAARLCRMPGLRVR
jgi:hypothetical protein